MTSSSSVGEKGWRFNKGVPAATAQSEPLNGPIPFAFKNGVRLPSTTYTAFPLKFDLGFITPPEHAIAAGNQFL